MLIGRFNKGNNNSHGRWWCEYDDHRRFYWKI